MKCHSIHVGLAEASSDAGGTQKARVKRRTAESSRFRASQYRGQVLGCLFRESGQPSFCWAGSMSVGELPGGEKWFNDRDAAGHMFAHVIVVTGPAFIGSRQRRDDRPGQYCCPF